MKNILPLISPRVLAHLLVLRPFLKLFCGVNVRGRENVLRQEQCIIFANHNSHLDILLLFSLLPLRQICRTHPVAAREYFSQSRLLFFLVNTLFSPIWLERGKAQKEENPLREIEETLESGDSIIVFPEGTRGVPGEMRHFKSGMGRLISEYPSMPIVPVLLLGPEKSLPKGTAFPMPIWNEVIIAPPQAYAGHPKDISHALEEIMLDLRKTHTAARQKRSEQRAAPPVTVAFLGIDGSGKSTVSRLIAEEMSSRGTACLVSDELKVYENGEAKKMQPLFTEKIRKTVGDYAKSAKSLKFYKLPKISELLLRDHLLGQIKRWYSPDFIIMDGSPLLNMVGWAGLYNEENFDERTCSKLIAIMTAQDEDIPRGDPIFRAFAELLSLKLLGLNHLTLPDTVVLIDASPDVACRRIDRRGEKKQAHETKDKLGLLRSSYLTVCNVLRNDWNTCVHVVDGNMPLEDVMGEARRAINENVLKGSVDV